MLSIHAYIFRRRKRRIFWEYSRFVKFDFEQIKGEAATVFFLLENIGNRTESTLARSGHFGRIVLVVCVGRFGLGPHAQYTRTYSGTASEDSCREGEGCRKGEVRSGNSPRGGMETLAALPAPSLDPGRSECAVNHAGREKRRKEIPGGGLANGRARESGAKTNHADEISSSPPPCFHRSRIVRTARSDRHLRRTGEWRFADILSGKYSACFVKKHITLLNFPVFSLLSSRLLPLAATRMKSPPSTLQFPRPPTSDRRGGGGGERCHPSPPPPDDRRDVAKGSEGGGGSV